MKILALRMIFFLGREGKRKSKILRICISVEIFFGINFCLNVKVGKLLITIWLI
jgi:hypothetical protein